MYFPLEKEKSALTENSLIPALNPNPPLNGAYLLIPVFCCKPVLLNALEVADLVVSTILLGSAFGVYQVASPLAGFTPAQIG